MPINGSLLSVYTIQPTIGTSLGSIAGNSLVNTVIVLQPDFARNVSITFDTFWDGGDITIAGRDIFGAFVRETILSNPDNISYSNTIFKTITSISKSAIGSNPDTAGIDTRQVFNFVQLNEQDTLFLIDCSIIEVTVRLPSTQHISTGRRLIFQKTDSSANNLIILPEGMSLIDGASSFIIDTQYNDLTIVNDNTNWIQLGNGTGGSSPGPQGVPGSNGFQGVNGVQGNQGSPGLQGANGIQGDQGATGATGSQGAAGTQGSIGAQGTVGSQGNTGTQGSNGSQGVAGTQGVSGSQGNDGAQGFQGALGTQGATGFQGTAGSNGAQGNQGTIGTQGNQGATGSQGTTGTQGTSGSQGNQGNNGSIGSQGNQGAVGSTGAQGNQGTQGNQGAIGTQGATGSQGNQGNQGSTSGTTTGPTVVYWYNTFI